MNITPRQHEVNVIKEINKSLSLLIDTYKIRPSDDVKEQILKLAKVAEIKASKLLKYWTNID